MQDTITITSAAITDRGLSDKRPQNEDSYLEVSSCGIYAVADGVGGAQAGDVASQMAVEILGEAFVNKSDGQDPEEVMHAAAERANAAIHQMSQEIPQLSTMATTLVALHIKGNVATIGHVGDSRLYRFEPGKEIVQETDDHSVVAEEVRAGRMTAEQAANHPAKNVISRALGAEPTVNIDLKTIMFSPGTTFLLCSDGVTRHIDDPEIQDLLASPDELEMICDRIKKICYDRGAEDNLTAVLVRAVGEASAFAETPSAASEPQTVEEEDVILTESEDEDTVATARSPFEEFAGPIVDTEPVIIGNGHLPEEGSDLDGLNALEELERSEYKDNTEPITAEDRATAFASTIGYTEEPKPKRGGKVLISLAMLILGTAIGGGAVYYWMQSHPAIERVEVPVLQEKSSNVPLTAFEESRREVDRNPEKFIAANASNPQDATDFYLLGRAYLVTGKYWDSKQALLKARDHLSAADPADAKTLATEISMALSIINSGPAQEAFAKDVSSYGSANQSTDANTLVAPR